MAESPHEQTVVASVSCQIKLRERGEGDLETTCTGRTDRMSCGMLQNNGIFNTKVHVELGVVLSHIVFMIWCHSKKDGKSVQ